MDLEPLQVRLEGNATGLNRIIEQAEANVRRAGRRIQDSATAVERQNQRLMQQGAQLTAALATPVERYRTQIQRLDRALAAGAISTTTYDRAVRQLKTSLPATSAAQSRATEAANLAAEAEARQSKATQEAAQITAAMATPLEKYRTQVQRLDTMLAAGTISTTTYDRAVRQLKTTLPAAASAQERAAQTARQLADRQREAEKAQATFDNEMARGRTIMESLLRPEERYVRLQQDLNHLLQMGAIDHRTYLQALARESTLLPAVQRAQAEQNEMLQRGRSITDQYRTANQRHQQSLAELNQLYARGYINQQTYTQGVRALRQQFDQLTPVLTRASTALNQLRGGLQRLGSTTRMGGVLSGIFVTAPLVGFATTGVRSLMEFDKAMTYSLSIADKVTPQLRQQMEQVAKTMSERSKFSAVELAGAYYELISAGLTAKSSMAALDTVNRFAIAGDMDLVSSTKQLAKATGAFGMQSDDAAVQAANMAKMANNLVVSANATTASIQDMTQAFLVAAPQARSTGMSLKEVTALLSYYQIVSTSAAEAGEHTAIGLRLIGTAYAEHKDFWKLQGLDLYEASGKMRKYTAVLKDMQKIYLNLNERGRVPFIKALGFEAMQQRAILPLLVSPEAITKIEEFEKKLDDANGLARISEDMMKSLTNQFATFKNTVQNVSMEVGLILMPYLQKFISLVRIGINYWKGLSDEGKRTGVVLGAIAAAAGPVLVALGTMIVLTGTLVGALAAVATAIAAVGAPFALVAAAAAVVVGAVAAVIAYSVAVTQWPAQTQKAFRVVERMWNAFQGFMGALFNKIFTEDFVKAFLNATLKIMEYTSPFMMAFRAALKFTGDSKKETENYAKDVAKNIQDAFDKMGGAMDLGGTLSRIIKEELDIDLSGESLSKKIKEQMGIDEIESNIKEEGDKVKKGLEETLKSAQGQAGAAGNSFSALSEKIKETSDRFKEHIALEREQARRGYDAVSKMTGAERELMKLELQITQERQDIIDRYVKEGLEPQNEKVQEALRLYDEQMKSSLDLTRAQAKELTVLEKQREQMDRVQEIANRQPGRKFAKEMKDIGAAMKAGAINWQEYQKELRKLRSEMMKEYKIDFKVGGVETMEAGTAQAAAALEEFVKKHNEALKPLKTPEEVLAEKARQQQEGREGGGAAVVAAGAPGRRAAELARRKARQVRRFEVAAVGAQPLPSIEQSQKMMRDYLEQRQIKQAEHEEKVAQSKKRKKAVNLAEVSPEERNEAYRKAGKRPPKEKSESLLERIAKATESTAKKKSMTIEPANLGG